jgi:hypothetical protein
MSDQNKLVPTRDSQGRLLPGHTANPNGRPKGSMNNTTKLASRRLAAHADRAARVILEALSDPDLSIRASAAKLILERSDRWKDEAKLDPNFATAREWQLLETIVGRIQRRQERGQQVRDVLADEQSSHPASEFQGIPPAAEIIDVQPLIIPLKPREEA